jgi:hypothetical protein
MNSYSIAVYCFDVSFRFGDRSAPTRILGCNAKELLQELLEVPLSFCLSNHCTDIFRVITQPHIAFYWLLLQNNHVALFQ